jgi:predicted nucleic acid-binding Zn ribbon protein
VIKLRKADIRRYVRTSVSDPRATIHSLSLDEKIVRKFFAARLGMPIPENLTSLLRWRKVVGERPAVQRGMKTRIEFLNDAGFPVPPGALP